MIFKLAYRTQLITALNPKPQAQHSNSNICRTLSQATSKPPWKTLRKSDYPNVKHWERRQNDAVQFAVIKVYDSDLSDSDSDSNGGITKWESGVLAFLEDKNGKVINRHERKRLYAELRGFWNDNIDSNCPPDNWSSAGSKQKESLEPANSQDETEVSLDASAPQPKKAKVGMASIPIAGPSQLVCQLIDKAHISITATTNIFF